MTDAVLDAQADAAAGSADGAPRKRNAERTRKAILAAALREFAQAGFAGARIEKIVKAAKCNIRMLYHYFGDKKGLYMAVLESAYMDLRAREAELKIDFEKPLDGFLELQRFTFDYFEKNPRFEGLLRNENLQHGKFAAQSRVVSETAFPLRRTIEGLIESGQRQGIFGPDLDPVQIYVTIAAMSRFHLANGYSLSATLNTDMSAPEWRRERLDHALALLEGYLTRGAPKR
ncbi:TetR/AcrR family transcriptional regulator [Caulobacter sp. SL161]|uniref:TetR/AcrR family transcriptional regulator n=1 Tax=Caulobacter sp. SL161 TaxID=2995156 RepID=UPI002273DCD2|nr:TetR/AcrR family transcriptional regulator [Caulobacter sp. SL161]MCY1648604.1 TetR/AcrR family transcriptional regulator [Caulobacter sp. SL161]